MKKPPIGTREWFLWHEQQRRLDLGRRLLQQIEEDYLYDLEMEAIMATAPGYSRVVDGWR
jgi:hypothetical protein